MGKRSSTPSASASSNKKLRGHESSHGAAESHAGSTTGSKQFEVTVAALSKWESPRLFRVDIPDHFGYTGYGDDQRSAVNNLRDAVFKAINNSLLGTESIPEGKYDVSVSLATCIFQNPYPSLLSSSTILDHTACSSPADHLALQELYVAHSHE